MQVFFFFYPPGRPSRPGCPGNPGNPRAPFSPGTPGLPVKTAKIFTFEETQQCTFNWSYSLSRTHGKELKQ